MPWREGAEIVKAGREQKQRDDHWIMYCNMYTHMTEETFVEFNEWYNSLKQERTPEKTAEEIMTDVNRIISMTIGEDNGITV